MKVYEKKEDKVSNLFVAYIVMALFLVISLGIFISFIVYPGTFFEKIEKAGVLLLFAIVFLFFDGYFFYYLFKKPVKYKAKLINKTFENYNNKDITYLEFLLEGEKKSSFSFSKFKCYTLEKNDLIVGNSYSISIKQFNWSVKEVSEIDSSSIIDIPTVNMNIVIYAIIFIFAGTIGFGILGLLLYYDYSVAYLLALIIFVFGVYYSDKFKSKWNKDNNKDLDYDQILAKELENVEPIIPSNKKSLNYSALKLVFWLFVLLLFWLFVIYLFYISYDLNFYQFLICYSAIICPIIPLLCLLITAIRCDKKIIRKYKLNVIDNININSIRSFKVLKPYVDEKISEYFIVDQDNNLIFIIKDGDIIKPKIYNICDHNNIKIGEIKEKFFTLTPEYLINLVDEKPFFVRYKVQLQSNYSIVGRNYSVIGDSDLIRNIICDSNDNEIAYISAISKNNNGWYKMGNIEVTLNDNVNNSIDIMLIAVCVAMGNLRMNDIKYNM
jgi:uncharacterized protein YxjI